MFAFGQSITAIVLLEGLIALPALDYNNGWSIVTEMLSLITNVLVVVGFVIVFFVFRENTFTSRAIEIVENQRTITTGFYTVVRHPMYSGIMLIIICTPLALGSLWGLIPAAILVGIIVLRLLDEEKRLKKTWPDMKNTARPPSTGLSFMFSEHHDKY